MQKEERKHRLENIDFWKKAVVFGIVMMFAVSALSMLTLTDIIVSADDPVFNPADNPLDDPPRSIEWEVRLDMSEPGGRIDYVVFGEAPDARDGPPPDSYDWPKPPNPFPPCIYSWFNDSLPVPYDLMMKDYRKYPDTYKVWNLSVQWAPSDYVTPTSTTISWDIGEVDDSEYSSVILYDDGGNPLLDMFIQNSYSFTCPAMTPQSFKIICNVDNELPETPSKPSGETKGYHGTSYIYNTSTTDPDGDDIFYFFNWSDGTNSGWVGPYANGELCSTSHTWQIPGTYSITVKAKDVHGEKSGWSPQLLVAMENRAPDMPSNPSPGNGITGVDTNAALSWTCGDPDTGDIITYDIYFGSEASPPKIVSKQSSTSFAPSLSAEATYYWKIIAWDNYDESTSGPVWSFTTKEPFNGGTPNGGNTDGQENMPPNANASASESVGLVNSLLTFDGSQSFDQDGYIKDWSWDFGDGTNGTGEIVTHAYSNSGTYNVTLTVTDNDDAKDEDSITVVIGTANNPPSNPIVTGETTGNKNVEYQFSATSTDLDNDSISYTFKWGDGTTTTSGYVPNGTTYTVNHSWTSAGKYFIVVIATDNQTTSGQSEITILIDVHYVGSIGYVIDIDGDGIFDMFRNDTTAIETVVGQQDIGNYLIDIDGDGNWDYVYNQTTETIIPFEEETIDEVPWTVVALIVIALAIISLIVYFYKKGYF